MTWCMLLITYILMGANQYYKGILMEQGLLLNLLKSWWGEANALLPLWFRRP